MKEEIVCIVRKKRMDASTEAHPTLVVIKEYTKALEYIAEHQGLLADNYYFSIMSQEDFNRTV